MAQKEFPQIFPKPGWVEHDPEAIWKTQLATAKAALRKAKLTAKQIAAIGITNQRETTLLWDRETGRPIHHAIVWQDRRTAKDCDRLKTAGHAPAIRRKTGLVIDAYFSATKIAWLLKHVKGARALARRIGINTRAASSADSRAVPPRRTLPAQRWKASPIRCVMCSRPWRPTQVFASRNYAWTEVPAQTIC